MRKEKSLAVNFPEIAAEWHPTKNGELTPADVSKSSGRKVWWLGSCGHEWDAAIYSRVEGGCPICSGHRVLVGYNDLATTNPELAAQWHPTKNDNLAPTQVTSGSGKKAWWLCDKGHEWAAPVGIRNKGIGCPKCASEKQTSFPEQAIFFYINQITPAESRYLLNGKIEIDVYLPEYQIGVEYDGGIWHNNVQKDIQKNIACEKTGVRLIRVREPGCPSISGECICLANREFTELEEAIRKLGQILGKQIDIDLGRDQINIYECYIENEKRSSLDVKYPTLAAEWHPAKNGRLTPDRVTAGSNAKAWWRGSCGHEWAASIAGRVRGFGCPICTGRQVLPGYNDIATTKPELASQWHPTRNGNLTPRDVTFGSHKKVWWLGSCGHEWLAVVASRRNGGGCPICDAAMKAERVSNYAIKSNGTLLEKCPDIAAEWHPTKNGSLTPGQITSKNSRKVWWLGKCGHEWQATIGNRVVGGQGCAVCTGHQIMVGANDLATVNPEMSAQWHPTKNGNLTPQDVTPGTHKKVWWLGSCGHEWQSSIANRVYGGQGCPICAGKKVLAGFNDLASLHPELAAQWHPTKNGELTPADVSKSSGRKVWWLGSCGHEWQATVDARASGRSCPSCRRGRQRKK